VQPQPHWPTARTPWHPGGAHLVKRSHVSRLTARHAAAHAGVPKMPKIPAMPPIPPLTAHAMRAVKRKHKRKRVVHHVAPVVTAHDAPVEAAAPHAAPLTHAAAPVQHHAKHTRKAGPGDVRVRQLQKILVALGWRGDATTSGPLIPALQDGLYGPITRRNWQRSARKRNLDTTFARINGKWAHVSLATYKALLAVAQSKGLV